MRTTVGTTQGTTRCTRPQRTGRRWANLDGVGGTKCHCPRRVSRVKQLTRATPEVAGLALRPLLVCRWRRVELVAAGAPVVRDWTDPTATNVKNVEAHHAFPRAYLRDVPRYTDMKRINQVANFVPTDWATNNLISDRPPHEYWPDLLAARDFVGESLQRQMRWHGLPENWTTLPYEEYLDQRRRLIAAVVRDGYMRLGDPNYQPPLPDPHTIADEALKPGGRCLT